MTSKVLFKSKILWFHLFLTSSWSLFWLWHSLRQSSHYMHNNNIKVINVCISQPKTDMENLNKIQRITKIKKGMGKKKFKHGRGNRLHLFSKRQTKKAEACYQYIVYCMVNSLAMKSYETKKNVKYPTVLCVFLMLFQRLRQNERKGI